MHPIEEKIPSLPSGPGVYIMKGAEDTVLYVGKAKNLKARVRSYIGSNRKDDPKVGFLMSKVTALDSIVTKTEKEAFLLENTLIKKYRPRYNIHLKDDKTYLHILLDKNHPFPRLVSVRRPGKPKPGQQVFGPYSSAMAVRDTLRQIHRLYPLRTCKDREFGSRKRPCLQGQMDRCSGACVGSITEKEYRDMVDQAVLILQGRSEELVRQQEEEMRKASEAMRFEEAAQIRDRIQAIRLTMERQRVADARGADRDVVGSYREGGSTALALLEVRSGNLVERKNFFFSGSVMAFPELLRSFLLQYYTRTGHALPPEVLLPDDPEDGKALEGLLTELRGASFSLRVPKRGEKRRLVELADANAKALYEEHERKRRGRDAALEEIQKKLRLPNPPRRIECFDLSTLRGEQAVGSCAVFQDGLSRKDGYRRYKIRTAKGTDDYGMMYEVLRRRIERGAEQDDLPDLLLIDGGKGHLGVAMRVLKDLGIRTLPIAAIAKTRKQRHGKQGETIAADGDSSADEGTGLSKNIPVGEPIEETPHEDVDSEGLLETSSDGEEESGEGEEPSQDRETDRLFIPGRTNPVGFSVYSSGLRMLQQIRDEAHRFALTYHRRLRSRDLERSELDGVPGIGPKRKKALLKTLGDLEGVRRASVEELAKVPGMSESAARAVWEHFRKV